MAKPKLDPELARALVDEANRRLVLGRELMEQNTIRTYDHAELVIDGVRFPVRNVEIALEEAAPREPMPEIRAGSTSIEGSIVLDFTDAPREAEIEIGELEGNQVGVRVPAILGPAVRLAIWIALRGAFVLHAELEWKEAITRALATASRVTGINLKPRFNATPDPSR